MPHLLIYVILSSLADKVVANESIALAFENWDFGHYNSHSYELLIVAFFGIIVIAFILYIVSMLIRKTANRLTERNKNRTGDVEANDKRDNWLRCTDEDDDELAQVLVHAELVRLQGDEVPDLEI